MGATKWTPEQKADALRLLAEFGKAEAARQTGIPAGTIASWGHREGVTAPTPETLRPVVEARQVSLARRKTLLAERLVTAAERILARADPADDDVRPEAIDVKRLMDAVGVAMNTAQLLAPAGFAPAPAAPAEQAELAAEPAARERALALVRDLGTRAS